MVGETQQLDFKFHLTLTNLNSNLSSHICLVPTMLNSSVIRKNLISRRFMSYQKGISHLIYDKQVTTLTGIIITDIAKHPGTRSISFHTPQKSFLFFFNTVLKIVTINCHQPTT